jgi:hypothetical protein
VQNNNALVLRGRQPVDLAAAAFESYESNSDDVAGFAATPPASTGSLGLAGIVIEALRIFDHYHFRVTQKQADETDEPLALKKPPAPDEPAWWDEYHTNRRKLRDRELFA